MYVKKSISLLLSGALFASLCAGCSQTTMEHHFFTDTETETEINTEVVGANLPEIEELQNFLSTQDIKLEVSLYSGMVASAVNLSFATPEEMITQSNTEVTSAALSEAFKDRSLFYLFRCGDPHEKNELTTFLSDTKNAINKLHVAFKGLSEDDFTNLKKQLAEDEGSLVLESNLSLSVYGLHNSADGQYYVVALLLNGGQKWVEWK